MSEAPRPGHMTLIGQYDSPFVRRVGIALVLYGLPFDHLPWSVFGDGAAIRALNPLMRVPTLVLEDGFVLTDSHMMLDHLDSRVPRPLFPPRGPDRLRALQRAALACGVAEKAVALFYERRLHDAESALWTDRCRLQIGSGLAALEAAAGPGPFWSDGIGHDDIALTCALRFVAEAHPGLLDMALYPRLVARAAAMEATAPFRTINQPFAAPA